MNAPKSMPETPGNTRVSGRGRPAGTHPGKASTEISHAGPLGTSRQRKFRSYKEAFPSHMVSTYRAAVLADPAGRLKNP